MKGRGWLIAVSIILGIVLSCAILPLGGMALLLSAAGGENTGPVPATNWAEQVISGSGTDRIVVIDVSGAIGIDAGSGVFSNQVTHAQLLSQFRQAAEDARVRAVVVRVDSPGGGVVASSEIYSALQDLRAADKHVVISMGSVAASGGYYIATAGERIYANPDTLTGSLGVIVTFVNVEEAFDTLGLRQVVFKSGEFKDIGSPSRTVTTEEAAIFQGIVDEAYQGFVDVIEQGRGLPREEVLRIADGRIYTGRQALELNLVDALGDLDDAITGAQELAGLEEALVVRYRGLSSFRDLLFAQMARSQQPADPLGLRVLVEPQAPQLEYRLVP